VWARLHEGTGVVEGRNGAEGGEIMSAGFIAAWYDLWIGMYWNSAKRRLYVLPVPCLGFYVEFPKRDKRGL
jgi:hypothetical protein